MELEEYKCRQDWEYISQAKLIHKSCFHLFFFFVIYLGGKYDALDLVTHTNNVFAKLERTWVYWHEVFLKVQMEDSMLLWTWLRQCGGTEYPIYGCNKITMKSDVGVHSVCCDYH